mgnify:CR=1 FL=1
MGRRRGADEHDGCPEAYGPVQLDLFACAAELDTWRQEQVLAAEWAQLVAERRHLRVVR